MNCIESFIETSCELTLPKNKRRSITLLTLKYIYRILSSRQFAMAFNKEMGKPTRTVDLRKTIVRDGYIMKNVKLWLYYSFFNNAGSDYRKRKALESEFNISKEDSGLHLLLPDLKKDFTRFKREGFQALTLHEMDRNLKLQVCDSHFKSFIAKFVHKKMRFIVQTQGLEYSDLQQDIVLDGVQAAFFYYPSIKNTLHCQNIIKRKAVNSGKNLILFYTKKKRSKLSLSEDGCFTNKIVPISFAVTDDSCTEFLSSTIDNNPSVEYDLTLGVRKVLSQYNGKRQKFLHLIMYYDEDFSKWLVENNISKLPNDEYLERCKDSNVYISNVLTYLGVTQEVGQRFVSSLKRKLA